MDYDSWKNRADNQFFQNKKKKNYVTDALLERRKHAADFALKMYNKSVLGDERPIYYINSKDKSSLRNTNDNLNKKRIKSKYESLYGYLRNNSKREINENNDNSNLNDENFMKANNTSRKTNSGFKHNLQMERIITENYPDNSMYNYKYNHYNSYYNLTSPGIKRNKSYFELNHTNNDNKYNKTNISNDLYQISDNSKLLPNEGEENHRFYDSSGIKDYENTYETYKVNKMYNSNNNNIFNNNTNNINENQYDLQNNEIKEMSPIKTESRNKDLDNTVILDVI